MSPHANLSHTSDLLQSVYGQLNVYRDQIVSSESFSLPTVASIPFNTSITSTVNQHTTNNSGNISMSESHYQQSYLLLYSAIQNLAHQLSSNLSANIRPAGDGLLMRGSTLFTSPPFTNDTSQTWPHSSWPSSPSSPLSSLSLINNLPMPTDEESLNSALGLGPVRDPLWTAIPMTVLYVLILVTGVVGNGVTCAVIARNRYMHTATNYYLFSLAISDLLLLVLGLPQEIQQIWRRYPYAFGEAFCVLRGFSSEASTNSSVLTITAFTMERYVAICHPLRAHTMSKLSRAVKLIVVIWLLGFLCAAPIAYQFGIVFDYVHDEVLIPQSATCNIKRPVPYLEEHIFALQSLLVFVLPVTLISVLYVLIGVKLRQSSQNAQADMCRIRRKPVRRLPSDTTTNNNNSSASSKCRSSSIDSITHTAATEPNSARYKLKHLHSCGSDCSKYSSPVLERRARLSKFKLSNSSTASTSTITTSNTTSTGNNSLSQRRAVIKMLTAVVVAFFVCFAPFHAQRLMAIYVKNPSHYETLAFNLLTYISGVTYYLSATINPILYSIMSVRFRQAFHDTFVRTFCPSRAIHYNSRGRSLSQMYYNSQYSNSYRYGTPGAAAMVSHSINITSSILHRANDAVAAVNGSAISGGQLVEHKSPPPPPSNGLVKKLNFDPCPESYVANDDDDIGGGGLMDRHSGPAITPITDNNDLHRQLIRQQHSAKVQSLLTRYNNEDRANAAIETQITLISVTES